MITLITGVPGMGKSALVISMMLDELASGTRPFFVKGIPGLTLDHSVLPPVEEWTKQVPDPDDPKLFLDYFTFPPNSIIVVDEAQRVYRPRASASKVPAHVSALETHRHTGVDFWLLTQKPHLLDTNVRELCGRHIHIRNGLLGRWLYEWPEYTDVKSKENFALAVKRKFRPPKIAFDKYKSAELHTKQKYRLNQVFIFLAMAVSFAGYFGWHVFSNFQKHHVFAGSDVAQKTDLIPTASAASVGSVLPVQSITPAHVDVAVSQIPVVHPYIGYNFTILGTMKSASKSTTYYRLTNDAGQSLDVTDHELQNIGYNITQKNDCSSFLLFKGAQITAACNSLDLMNAQGGTHARAGGGIHLLPGASPEVALPVVTQALPVPVQTVDAAPPHVDGLLPQRRVIVPRVVPLHHPI